MQNRAEPDGRERPRRPTFGERWQRHGHAVVLALIVLASLAFRVHVSRACSLWLDEVGTELDVQKPWTAVLRGAERVHPPLLFILIKLVFPLFGDSETSLRAVSLAFGCVLLVAVDWLGAELGLKPARRLIVVAWVAITPFFMRHATEARHYALYPAVGTLATAATLRLLREPTRLAYLGGFAISAAAMAATHYFGLPYAVALAGVIVVGALPHARRRAFTRRRALSFVLILVALFAVCTWIALRAVALARFYARPETGDDTLPWRELFGSIVDHFAITTAAPWVAWTELLLAIFGLVWTARSLEGIARLVPAALAFGPCIGALFITSGHFVAPRYLAPSWVLYQVGACIALFTLGDRIRLAAAKAPAKLASALAWTPLAVLLGLRVADYPVDYGAGEDDYRGLQHYFIEHLAADTALVTFDAVAGQRVMGNVYRVGKPPLTLESFRRVPGINRYLIAEIHVSPSRQPRLEALVRARLGLSPAAWRALPLFDLPETTYQPAVPAHMVVFEGGRARTGAPPNAGNKHAPHRRHRRRPRRIEP
jgi:hypothetical protein